MAKTVKTFKTIAEVTTVNVDQRIPLADANGNFSKISLKDLKLAVLEGNDLSKLPKATTATGVVVKEDGVAKEMSTADLAAVVGESLGLKRYEFRLPMKEKKVISIRVGSINIVESIGVVHGLFRKQFKEIYVVGNSNYATIGASSSGAVRIYSTPGDEENSITIENNYNAEQLYSILITTQAKVK